MKPKSRDDYERLESTLNPHRVEEQRAAAREVAARLGARGVDVAGTEDLEDLASLLEAVERFEAGVKAHGGDLMVDDLKSSQPDDRHFVLPRRAHGERIRVYIGRIDQALAALRHHPRRPD
jgi:hypothetical protein